MADRSRSHRRHSKNKASVKHFVMPGLEVASATPRKNETISAFLRRTEWAYHDKEYGWQFKKGLPTVLEINGKPLLRRHWRSRRIGANDNIRFVSYPLGGQGRPGGKQVLGLVALIAVAAFALWVPGALEIASGTFASYGTTAAVGLGGSTPINILERDS